MRYKVRQSGIELDQELTMDQIKALPAQELDKTEVLIPNVGWCWAAKWSSDGSDIEVVL